MGIITTEHLTKILSETQAVISECNSRCVHGSVEVNARLFENVLMELLRHRAAMLQGAENAETHTTMQTAPALDSSQIIAESPTGNSPVLPDGWVACSEQMPEQFKAILAFNEYGEVWSGAYDRYWNFYCDNLLVEHVTHWMPLPAAPQQEA